MYLPWRYVTLSNAPPIFTPTTESEARLLGALAVDRDVLEVGTAHGFTAIVMARHGARHVLTVDIHPCLEDLAALRRNVQSCGAQQSITIMNGFSERLLPTFVRTGARFGLIFIDGSHDAQAIRNDLIAAQDLLTGDGILAVHDYGEVQSPAVAVVCNELMGDPMQLVDTLAVWRKEE